MKITISGDLGSGKTTVAKLLAERLGYKYLSTGAIQRQIAGELGLTTLDLNLLSERQTEIDDRIDGHTQRIGQTDDDYVIDSRLAWHFIPDSLKVFITVDEVIAAQRISGDASRESSEELVEPEAMVEKIRARRASEKRRFLDKYGIDYRDLNNFDLVIDSSNASVEEVAAIVLHRAHPEDRDTSAATDPA